VTVTQEQLKTLINSTALKDEIVLMLLLLYKLLNIYK